MEFKDEQLAAFRVPLCSDLFLRFRHKTRKFWHLLGNIETSGLREDLEKIHIEKPVFIAGLPRSGSTMLLEIVASHPDVVTHCYADIWNIFTPYRSAQKSSKPSAQVAAPVERSHGDGVMVTPESPEAMEEILWTSFFDDLHDCRSSNVLDEQTEHRSFESFYQDHIRKLLMIRDGHRYAAKGNYNLARLLYLLELFPDARFVIPVRHPRGHVASLKKQHALFSRAAERYPRSVSYLDRVGHFEFGAHRRPVNHGDDQLVQSIVELWQRGDEVRGWARYWSHVYGSFHRQLRQHSRLQPAVLIVRYEDLCDRPSETLDELVKHCELHNASQLIDQFSEKLHAPTYYVPEFTDDEEAAIEEETREVAALFEYASESPADSSPQRLCSQAT